MNSIIALLIGIVSSLFATAIFICLTEIIRKIALPWYADKIYRGVRIEGRWKMCSLGENELSSDIEIELGFNLEQSGDVVTGHASMRENNEKPEVLFSLSGRMRDGYFSATAWPVASDHVDVMACVFRIFYYGDHLRMKGKLIYLDNQNAVITGLPEEVEYIKTET